MNATDEQNKECANLCKRAALSAFGEFSDELSQDDLAKRTVFAFRAASSTQLKYDREFRHQFMSFDFEVDVLVAGVYWFWTQNQFIGTDIDDLIDDSQVGTEYLGFAQGMTTVRAMSNLSRMLDDNA